jgi:hypothetical protein
VYKQVWRGDGQDEKENCEKEIITKDGYVPTSVSSTPPIQSTPNNTQHYPSQGSTSSMAWPAPENWHLQGHDAAKKVALEYIVTVSQYLQEQEAARKLEMGSKMTSIVESMINGLNIATQAAELMQQKVRSGDQSSVININILKQTLKNLAQTVWIHNFVALRGAPGLQIRFVDGQLVGRIVRSTGLQMRDDGIMLEPGVDPNSLWLDNQMSAQAQALPVTSPVEEQIPSEAQPPSEPTEGLPTDVPPTEEPLPPEAPPPTEEAPEEEVPVDEEGNPIEEEEPEEEVPVEEEEVPVDEEGNPIEEEGEEEVPEEEEVPVDEEGNPIEEEEEETGDIPEDVDTGGDESVPVESEEEGEGEDEEVPDEYLDEEEAPEEYETEEEVPEEEQEDLAEEELAEEDAVEDEAEEEADEEAEAGPEEGDEEDEDEETRYCIMCDREVTEADIAECQHPDCPFKQEIIEGPAPEEEEELKHYVLIDIGNHSKCDCVPLVVKDFTGVEIEYCRTCNKAISYSFEQKSWTPKEAKVWVEKNLRGEKLTTKSTEGDLIEGLIEKWLKMPIPPPQEDVVDIDENMLERLVARATMTSKLSLDDLRKGLQKIIG